MTSEVTSAAPIGRSEEVCSSGRRPRVASHDREGLPVNNQTKLVPLYEGNAPVRTIAAAENLAQLFQADQEK